MNFRLLIILVAVALLTPCAYADNGKASSDTDFFRGSVTKAFGTTTAEFLIESIPTNGIEWLSIQATITATQPVVGNLKLVGSNTKITDLTSFYTIDDRSAQQSWTATGLQDKLWITDKYPSKFIGFSATFSSATTNPGSITLDIRGLKHGNQIGFIKWQ